MRQKSDPTPVVAEKLVRDIRRATRKQYSAEEKIRVVLDGLRGETSDNRAASSLMTWRNRCVCWCRMIWLAIRLEYWTSFRHRARLTTNRIPEVDGEDERVPARVIVT
jgi:hypothetical protein